jgi:hypothetical protein
VRGLLEKKKEDMIYLTRFTASVVSNKNKKAMKTEK